MPVQPKKIYAVSELTEKIKALLEERYAFIWISGEISNCKAAASGHTYFTLKDARAQISAVMFRASARRLRQPLRDGMQVAAMGRVSVYAPRGSYQFIAEFVEAQGAGELLMAVEALKQKLSAEGLFDAAAKRELPALPGHVAVITSPAGSVIRDILQVSGRRWADIPIDIAPVTVQGASAAAEIVAAFETIARRNRAAVVILARGGGSIEDLMAFNDESVARAIRRCPVPVVSAIGHETDTTIADLVADLRAPTPSAAAELVFPVRAEWQARVADRRQRLESALRLLIDLQRTAVADARSRLKHPRRRITDGRLRLDELLFRLDARLGALMNRQREQFGWRRDRLMALLDGERYSKRKVIVEEYNRYLLKNLDNLFLGKRKALDHLTARLNDLSPQAILKRGYSITRSLPQGRPLRQAAETAVGAGVEIQLAHGQLLATITATDTGAPKAGEQETP